MSPVLLCLLALAAPQPPIPLGSAKQLFIDHKFMESSEGFTLTLNPPHQTGEVLLAPDAEWERDATISSYSTVLKEERNGKPVVRLWYGLYAGERKPRQNPSFMGVAYAESDDGIRFRKPVLGLVEKDGSRRNNLVLPADPSLLSVGGGSVLRDERPGCPPGERYKSWSKHYPKPGSGIRGPHRVWVSPDGLHWRLHDSLVTGLRAADTQPTWFWDPRIGRYIGYSREWIRGGPGGGARMASYNESDDMLHWDSMLMALEPDALDRAAEPAPVLDLTRLEVKGEDVLPQHEPLGAAPLDFYGPGVFRYEGAEDVYFAMIPVYHHWRKLGEHTWPDTTDVQLAVSRDAIHFQRMGRRQPFLRLGREGAFDSRWVWPMVKPVPMGDELWIYYLGTNTDHSGRRDPKAAQARAAISRSILRLDGFVSADAGYGGGWLLTPPLTFQGSRLELNLDTGAGGWARVEILDAAGKPLAGFGMAQADPINANSVRFPVTWQGRQDLSALAGRPIRLRIQARACKLYAFQFRDARE